MSDNKLFRRSFFRLVGGGIAAAIAAPYAIKEAIVKIPVEFGWTWYVDKKGFEPGFANMISKTLRDNTNKIMDNIGKNNVLLAKLKDGTKVQLDIDYITPEDQTQRMKVRLHQRFEERVLKIKQEDIKYMDKENQEQIIERTKLALQNKLSFEKEDCVSNPDGSITYFKYENGKRINLANVKWVPSERGPIKEVKLL